jgi:DNA topoisomerase I
MPPGGGGNPTGVTTTAPEGSREAAEAAGLRYVHDGEPCVRRRRRGRGWEYTGPGGERVADADERRRFDALAIPPAWTDVWICPDPDGHIQATGRDAKGRKQYRYHSTWRQARDETKFDQLGGFGATLPEIRHTVRRQLGRRGLPRDKVLGLVIHLLDRTLIRVGNDEYAVDNDAYGLTTLRSDHVDVEGSRLMFDFQGKGGADWQVVLRDRRLARIVEQCEDLGGYELFAYEDGSGAVVDVDSSDVNDHLRDMTGEDITSKDFRTWGGTVEVALTLARQGAPGGEREAERNIRRAIDAAADRLNNTRAVARSSYVHPRIPDAYRDGELLDRWKRARRRGDLDRPECLVLALLTKP